MTRKLFSIAAVALLAACGGDDAAEVDGDAMVVTDTATTTVQGTDVAEPVVVPTTDSVVTMPMAGDTLQAGAAVTDTTTQP